MLPSICYCFGSSKMTSTIRWFRSLSAFLDANVQGDAEFGTELWRVCGVLSKLEKSVAVPRTSESLCFALQLIAVFGKLEPMFASLHDNSRVLKALNRLGENTNASEQASYLDVVTSFLSHQSGRAWCIEHGVSSKVFQCLQHPSVFVQGKAEAFFVALLKSDLSGGDCGEIAAFVNKTLTEELPPRQRRKCLHVVRSLLENNPQLSKKLCSEFNVHKDLLGCCVAWMSTSEAASAAADVLAKLASAMQDDGFFEEAMDLFSRDKLVSIKFAASFIQESASIRPCISKETEQKIAEILTSPIATKESELGDKSKVRALQSTAVCELKRALPHFVHTLTHEMVIDKIVQFLLHSPATKVTRLLSVALECFAFAVKKVDLVRADPTQLTSYLDNLAPFLRDPNLSAHALKQALAISLTLACVMFSSAGQGFDWRACAALCSFGESLQRHLVSTEPQFVEAALDSFSGIVDDVERFNLGEGTSGLSCLADWLQHCGLARFVWDNLRHSDGRVRASAVAAIGQLFTQEWLWTHFCSHLSLKEADVVKEVLSMALDDTDVLPRWCAASTLRSWLDRDCLGLRSRHRGALQRCASDILSLDLDYRVQLAGLSIWKTLLGETLNTSSVVSDSTVKELLREADTAGFGASMKKAMASDAVLLRRDAQAFLHQLLARLHGQCSFSGEACEMGSRQHGVNASNDEDKPVHCTEAEASMDSSDTFSNADRSAAMEEVLDLGVSECLQRKLKFPENIQTPATSLAADSLQLELVHTTDLLAKLSPLGTFRKCDAKPVSLDSQSCDSLLADILAAAASEH
ncbi:uncharacterized protein LOC119452769 isoform X5 [Dermacentor silvarum]|uniref:uncharacterized protein LOC119452769 isoform X5 n=1 Tax=Dermacentor silvarum TaxID=543639 RepID=UPI0021009FF6|nr:uncharacterized protein LOC119452769 isoform X5 [Dermacentor silvarum]